MATNETLSKIIKKLNEGNVAYIIVKSLSSTVDFIRYPLESEPGAEANWRDNYLIKKDNIYVGIVLDMERDLHIYVEPKFRKKTTLMKDLDETIIPHLLLNRKEQPVSFVNKKVAAHFLNKLKSIVPRGLLKAAFVSNGEKYEIKPSLTQEEFREKAIAVKNKGKDFLEKSVNPLAIKFLYSEGYVSIRNYHLLTKEEKIGYSRELFIKDMPFLNEYHKERTFIIKWAEAEFGMLGRNRFKSLLRF